MGPVLIAVGAVLILVHLNGRRPRRRQQTPLTRRRAVLRLVWDLTAGALILGVYSAFILAPRNSPRSGRR